MKLDYVPLPESKQELKNDTDIAFSTTKLPLKQQSAVVVFGTTFLTIFLAEIGDKTQLSTLFLSAQSHSPWVVFLGSAAALVTTSLLSVVLGSWIASRLSPQKVEKAAGMMLLLISLMLFWDLIIGY